MLTYSEIEEDVKELKKMYGSNIEVEVGDDYYVCYFTNSFGTFKFLVDNEKLHKPFSLSYTGDEISKVIEKLQEL